MDLTQTSGMSPKLKPVPAKHGLNQLIDDLDRRRDETVFCLCSAAVDYQIGWREAAQIFARWGLVTIDNTERLCPVFVSMELFQSRDRFLRLEDKPLSRVKSVQKILGKAFPRYVPGKPLMQQPDPIRDHLIRAFIRLVVAKYLPESVAQTRFGHLGMVLLMREAFQSDKALSEYLRAPGSVIRLTSAEEKSFEKKVLTELARPLGDDDRTPKTTTGEILSLQDLIDRLERSKRPGSQDEVAQARDRLEQLLNPSAQELEERFHRNFSFDPAAADALIAEAEQLLAEDVGTSGRDRT